jgi:hypothetical protein
MKGNGGEMKRSLPVLAYLAAKDVIRKVRLTFLLLLCLIFSGSLLPPSDMALAQDSAIEAAEITLELMADGLRWGVTPESFAGGRGFFLETTVQEMPGEPGVGNMFGVSGVVSIGVFASHEEALQETETWNDNYDSIQPTTFHGYKAFRYTVESPPFSRLSWFCGGIWFDVGVLRPGQFPQSLEELTEGLHNAAELTWLYHYCEAPGLTPVAPTPTATPLAPTPTPTDRLTPTPAETPTPHATPAVAWASVCAVAKPSIAGGSLFTDAEFTITGDEPQTIRVTTAPAENFAIVRTDVGRRIAYQNSDFQSYGSLTLKPGTYELSCAGRGAIGLMSNKVCIQYPVAQEAPPATTEPKSGVVLPPRPVVLATAPDGSKLIAVPGPGAFNYSLIPGEIRLEVGQTRTMRLRLERPDGSSEPAWWQSADPGDLAMVERAGVKDGHGVSRVTGGWAGQGWLRGSGGFRTRLVVLEAPPDPTEAWQKGEKATIEVWVTRNGSPVKGASIHLNHQDYVSGSPSGKSFDDPKWKTDEQGYCKIETTGLFAGSYKVRVVKMHEADKGQNFASNMWSKKEPPFTLAPGQIAEFAFEIKMQTMREKYPGIIFP